MSIPSPSCEDVVEEGVVETAPWPADVGSLFITPPCSVNLVPPTKVILGAVGGFLMGIFLAIFLFAPGLPLSSPSLESLDTGALGGGVSGMGLPSF